MRGERELPKTSSRWGAVEAEALLTDCRRSGLGLGEYCRRRKIGYERLRRWRGQLERSRGQSLVALAPVHVVGAPPRASSGRMELRLGQGRRVRLGPDFDPEALSRLLRVLGA
jgi:transposase